MVLETHLYDILSVSMDATTEEISKSYKKLALKCHPDKTNHNEELTEKFKEMTRAYEILKDSNTRNVYDHYGEAGIDGSYKESVAKQRRSNESSCGFRTATNIFSQVFNDINSMFARDAEFGAFTSSFPFNMSAGMPQGNFKKHVQPANTSSSEKLIKGQDIHHTFKVTLGDLYFGKVVKFQLPKNSTCRKCSGVGGFNPKSCRTCKGQGQVVITLYNQFSQCQEISPCKHCNGTGIFIAQHDECLDCSWGYVKDNKIIKVNIFPGSKNGDRIILQGEADEGRNVIPGDVIIHLQEIHHPYLVRRFNDLYTEHEIDLKTALLGGEVILHDFLRKGRDLKIFINVHGYKKLNESVNKSIQKGEVVGTINSGEPKIAKNFGMPINDSDGIFYENINEIDDFQDVIFDLNRYKKGDLFIKFNVKLPSVSDFTRGEQDLLMLQNILPDSVKDDRVSNNIMESHLSNLPNYDSIPHSCSNSVSNESLNIQSRNAKPESDNECDVSTTNYYYDDIDIEDNKVDTEEIEDQLFYDKKWIKEESVRGKKRRRDGNVNDINFNQSGIEC